MLKFIQNNVLIMDLVMPTQSVSEILEDTWPIIVVVGLIIISSVIVLITINNQRKIDKQENDVNAEEQNND